MAMDLTISASTSGPDDAEALAQLCQHVADLLRKGGGDPVRVSDGELEAGQSVFYSVSAGF